MKNLYSLLFLLLFAYADAQVYIPDPVFKNFLVSNAQFDTNSNGEIDFSEIDNIGTLYIANLPITDFTGLQEFASLSNLDIRQTNAAAINLTGLNNLYSVTIYGNAQLESLYINQTSIMMLAVTLNPMLLTLDASGMPHLYSASIGYNGLQTLSMTNDPILNDVNVSHNALTAFTISNCSAIWVLNCSANQLTSLDLSGIPQLSMSLDCGSNLITSLDLSVLPNLKMLDAENNHITTLDFSLNPQLENVAVYDNQLTSINMKNGKADTISFQNNPDLRFICVDPQDVTNINQTLASYGMTNVVVNSYCNFTPGGPFNTIEGIVKFDAAANGCDASDAAMPSVKINVSNGSANENVFTNAQGDYSFYVNTGNYTLTPSIENPPYFVVSPASAMVGLTGTGNTETRNFCVSANGIHPDLEVVLSPLSALEPGFDVDYLVTLRNKGNQILNGNVSFAYDGSRLDYVGSSPAGTSENGSVGWTYSGLQPFGVKNFRVKLNVNSPTEMPSVNIGDSFDFTASSAVANDENPGDNSFSATNLATGSLDPNDKTCLEGALVSSQKIGDYLHYLIRFENTGSAAAHNVVVKDLIDTAKFDMSSLQFVTGSHNPETHLSGNKAEFIFEGIELAPTAKGYVLFKIKTLSTLAENTTVSNQADIFFDYNFPIATNNAETTFQSLSVHDNENIEVSAYPIPTKDALNLRCKTTVLSIEIYDVQGRLLFAKIANANEVSIDFSNRASGTYFVKVFSEKGTGTLKFVKE